MASPYSLEETEKVMRRHVADLELDFEAAHAVSSIYRAANAVRAHMTGEVLRGYDITWTGFVVLWVVWIYDGLETRHAAESAGISKGTLTGVVKTLESRGWIARTGRQDDRRLVELSLTPAGHDLMAELYPRFNAVESRVVAGLSGRRRHEMVGALREIVATIDGSGPHLDGPA